jgi:hypothetical protein
MSKKQGTKTNMNKTIKISKSKWDSLSKNAQGRMYREEETTGDYLTDTDDTRDDSASTLKIVMQIDNDAFIEDYYGEASRVLQDAIIEPVVGNKKRLMDVNGNTVGWAEIS